MEAIWEDTVSDDEEFEFLGPRNQNSLIAKCKEVIEQLHKEIEDEK